VAIPILIVVVLAAGYFLEGRDSATATDAGPANTAAADEVRSALDRLPRAPRGSMRGKPAVAVRRYPRRDVFRPEEIRPLAVCGCGRTGEQFNRVRCPAADQT
ncbi:hypothetical protein, partial [Nocardia carnea]|uniref:hypothetical protein n=1 Tax=Nocardia carnea TaxID=37328 RepID=UPI002458E177